MQRKGSPQRPIASDPGRPPGLDAADVAALRAGRDVLRRDHADAIRSVVSALVKHNIRAHVDSSFLRRGVTRAAVEEKIAEAIVGAFGFSEGDRGFGLSRTVSIKRGAAEAHAKAERHRDAYRRAARALKGVRPEWAALNKRDAEGWDALLNEIDGMRLNELQAAAAYLDDLAVEIVAIFDHATTLTPHYTMQEIAPHILAAAWACYPDSAPARGAENPLARYKRIKGRTDSWPDHLLRCRALLFAGDGRFPGALFQPHRRTRTVTVRLGSPLH